MTLWADAGCEEPRRPGRSGWWLSRELRGSLCIMAMGNLDKSKSRHREVK